MKKINNHKWVEFILVFLFLCCCEMFFLRNVLGARNTLLFSERSDGRLTNLLTEHWWNFFRGKEAFAELAMFYPAERVLGYTDLFFGYGLLYSLLRLLGLNMFLAYKWTIISVHCLGTVSMYYLLKKKLNIHLAWALFGTIAFSFSDTYARQLIHTQLGALSALPLLLIFFIGFIENFENRRRRNLYAYAFLSWFILLTYNSWYIAYFTGMFSLIFLLVYFVILKTHKIVVLSILWTKIKYAGRDIIGYLLFMIFLFLPFIWIYLPVLKESSGYSYTACSAFLPEFIDLINVTESNWMLGSFIKTLKLTSRGYNGEEAQGFSVVLLILFLALVILHFKKHKGESEKTFRCLLVNAIFISILVCLLLVIRLSSNGVSLWFIAYKLIPMSKSIRAVARFVLWLSFPMAIITALTADRYIVFKNKALQTTFSVLAITLLFISNINKIGVSTGWNAQDELNYITNVTAPPEDAKVFYLIDSSQNGGRTDYYHMDAFEIATWHSLKTINGYSGQQPDGWEGINDIYSENYEKNIFFWIAEHDLSNVYAYDWATNTWIAFEDRQITSLIDSIYSPMNNRFSLCSGSMDHNQGEYAWTEKTFKVAIRNSQVKNTGLVIKLHTPLECYMLQNPDIDPYVHLYVDGEYIQDIPIVDECVEYVIPMDDHEGDEYIIELKTNSYFIPRNLGLNDDVRNLSIALYYIGN